jgi:hypothetical protein
MTGRLNENLMQDLVLRLGRKMGDAKTMGLVLGFY